MQIERIEELKRQYTDRYVVVDGSRPELARFKDKVGQVKTVNFSGRALVQFESDADIGWYDIDPDFLTVVDKPEPKPAPAKAASAPKATAKTPAKTQEETSNH